MATRKELQTNSNITGKSFIVANRLDMYRKMIMYTRPTCYEVILEGSNVFLYMDIEITLNDEEEHRFSFDEVHQIILLLKKLLIQHLDLSFPSIDHQDQILILQACSPSKFSIHIIHRGVVFADHSCSCASYVAEFAAYVKKEVSRGIVRHLDDAESENIALLSAKSRIKSHPSFIDQSVYKRSQQFRTFGSSKISKNRPLVLYTGILNEWSERNSAWFNMTDFNFASWVRTLVTVNESMLIPLTVKPSPHIQYLAVNLACNRLYLHSISDNMLASGRFLDATHSTTSTENATSATDSVNNSRRICPREIVRNLKKTIMLPTVQKGLTSIIDDTGLIVDEYQNVRQIWDIHQEERVFCLICETNVESMIGIGVCSAKMLTSRSGERAMFCFNCGTTMFVLECGDQYGFYAARHELVISDNRKLNYNGSVDIDFDLCQKVVFLDAPMGSGKTHITKTYISRLDKNTSILSVTFRVSLARYLAEQFQLNCYLDADIFGAEGKEKRRRLVVCLDSLHKIDIEEYDLIVIDEATFVQYHLLSGTIQPNAITSTLTKLKLYLQSASKVILMQHRIPDASINFYCNLISCDPFDTNIVTKKKFDKPTVLQPLKQWAQLNHMISFLVKDYINSYNTVDGKSNNPFIIFCSRVDFSLALLQILREVAQEQFDDHAVSRIKGVWAQIQNDPWCSQFLTNPNAAAIDCDVLIVTNVLQAGHSIDTHFVTSYDILFNNVLSFREELQFVSRLRYLGRTDCRTTKHAWIEVGKSNQNIANYTKLKRTLTSMTSAHYGNDFDLVVSTLAAINSERADSSNRHSYLWKQEYERANVTRGFGELSVDNNDDFSYTPSWVRSRVMDYVKGTGATSIKTWMQLMNEQYMEDLNGILDEMQYCNVAELMSLHVNSNTTTLKERINCSDRDEGFNVVTNILHEEDPKSMTTVSAIGSSLGPYYNFISFIDYRLYLLSEGDPTKQRWWELRTGISSGSHVGSEAKLVISKFLNLVCELVGCSNDEYAINDTSFNPISIADIFEQIESNRFHDTYTAIFPTANNYNADKSNYCGSVGKHTRNRFLSKCFKRISLKMHTKDAHQPPFLVNIVNSLCICKALVTPDHFIHIESILSPAIVDRVHQTWAQQIILSEDTI